MLVHRTKSDGPDDSAGGPSSSVARIPAPMTSRSRRCRFGWFVIAMTGLILLAVYQHEFFVCITRPLWDPNRSRLGIALPDATLPFYGFPYVPRASDNITSLCALHGYSPHHAYLSASAKPAQVFVILLVNREVDVRI
jgi:hypothetical protein